MKYDDSAERKWVAGIKIYFAAMLVALLIGLLKFYRVI